MRGHNCNCNRAARNDYVWRYCDVCWLTKGDKTYKYVRYCATCDAYICDDCRRRWDLRAIAAMKRAAMRFIGR
jgi:hypothetical protein